MNAIESAGVRIPMAFTAQIPTGGIAQPLGESLLI